MAPESPNDRFWEMGDDQRKRLFDDLEEIRVADHAEESDRQERREQDSGWTEAPDRDQTLVAERELHQIAEAIREREQHVVPAEDLAARLPEGAREQYLLLLHSLQGEVSLERGRYVFNRLRLIQQVELPERTIEVQTRLKMNRDQPPQPPERVVETLRRRAAEPIEDVAAELEEQVAVGDEVVLRWETEDGPRELVITAPEPEEPQLEVMLEDAVETPVAETDTNEELPAAAAPEPSDTSLHPTAEQPITVESADPIEQQAEPAIPVEPPSPASERQPLPLTVVVDALWSTPEPDEPVDAPELSDHVTEVAVQVDHSDGVPVEVAMPEPPEVRSSEPARKLIDVINDYGVELNDLPPIAGGQDIPPEDPRPAGGEPPPDPPDEGVRNTQPPEEPPCQPPRSSRANSAEQQRIAMLEAALAAERHANRRRRRSGGKKGSKIPSVPLIDVFEKHWAEPLRVPDQAMRTKARKFLRYLARRYNLKLTPELESYLIEILLRPKLVNGRRVYGITLNQDNLLAVLQVLRYTYGGTPPAV